MTPAEYLPFEHGVKDGLLVYLKRLGIFLAVMAAAGIVCGLVGYFFIPHPPETTPVPQPTEDHSVGPVMLTLLSLGAAVTVLTFSKVLEGSAHASMRMRVFSLKGIFWALLASGTVLAFFSRDLEIALPLATALVTHLVQSIRLYRKEADRRERRGRRRR